MSVLLKNGADFLQNLRRLSKSKKVFIFVIQLKMAYFEHKNSFFSKKDISL